MSDILVKIFASICLLTLGITFYGAIYESIEVAKLAGTISIVSLILTLICIEWNCYND